MWRCKPCANAATRKWRAANLEKARYLARAQYWKDPEKGRACALRQRNKDVAAWNAKALDWKRQNPDKVSAYSKKWRAANPDRVADHYRAKHRKKKYDLIRSAYDGMVAAQEGKCAICKKTPSRSLCVDHDHVTGQIRALLCSNCNAMLGMAKDSIVTLQSAIAYLRAAEAGIANAPQSAAVTGS